MVDQLCSPNESDTCGSSFQILSLMLCLALRKLNMSKLMQYVLCFANGIEYLVGKYLDQDVNFIAKRKKGLHYLFCEKACPM